MAADIQSVIKMTTPAVTAPSSSVRTDSMEPPTFHLMPSSSSRITGSRPLTQSTTAIQASHEMVRSRALIKGASLNANCKTLTPRRISASDNSTGMASLKMTSGNRPVNTALQAKARSSSKNGNSTPSTVLRPNNTDFLSGSRRVLPARCVISQASRMQASKTANSVSVLGRRKASNHSSSVLIREVWVLMVWVMIWALASAVFVCR